MPEKWNRMASVMLSVISIVDGEWHWNPLLYVLPIQSNSSMHHYECIMLCKDISLQRGRFCTRSLASCIPKSSEDRSSWMFFIQVVRGRPGGRLQFSGGGSKMAWLASAFSSIHARRPKKVRRRDLMMDESGGWLVMRRMSAFLKKLCQRMPRILCIGTVGPLHQSAVYPPC